MKNFYIYYGDGYIIVSVSQNSLNGKPKKGEFY